MLEAEDLGLKSCMICDFDVEELTNNLQLPGNEKPVLALAIGYPSQASRPAKKHYQRKSIDELLTIIA